MVKDTFCCQQYAVCVIDKKMSMDNMREDTNRGKHKNSEKTFRIKPWCTALETNPGSGNLHLFELQYNLWNDRHLFEAKQTADVFLNLPNGLSAAVKCKN